jgi:putative tricarboxylic transport membrane protein
MKKLNYISGSVILGFALIIIFMSRKMPITSEFGPGSGLFPIVVSVILALLGLMILIQTWRENRHVKPSQETYEILGPNKKKYFIYLSLFFAFGIFLEPLGYLPTMTLFLLVLLKGVEKQSWKTTWGLIIICCLSSYIIFKKLLAVPLPDGILSFISDLM